MDNEVGEGFRQAYKEHLDVFGEDFHISGETRRGVFSDEKGSMKISFPPEEFAVKAGDLVTLGVGGEIRNRFSKTECDCRCSRKLRCGGETTRLTRLGRIHD